MGKGLTKAICQKAGPGYHFDNRRCGLYLRVDGKKTDSGKTIPVHHRWVQRITIQGKRYDLGLGPLHLVGLNEAREKAHENLKLARAGGDPRNQKQVKPKVRKATGIPTFEEAAQEVLRLQSSRWKNEKSIKVWISDMRNYVFPVIGDIPLDEITMRDVQDCLESEWTTKPATMKKIRRRIREVFSWAIASGFRNGNPASDDVLSVLPKLRAKTEHRKSMPHNEVEKAILAIRDSGGYVGIRLCLEFLILTGTRSGEVRGATWEEINFEDRTWTIPAERMKGGEPHKIPLSKAAMSVLKKAEKIGLRGLKSGLVFPGARKGTVMDGVILSRFLKDLGDYHPHGFRTSFSTWANENNYNPDAIEACLAHITPGVRGAYMRSDFFQQRREIMQAWGAYIG